MRRNSFERSDAFGTLPSGPSPVVPKFHVPSPAGVMPPQEQEEPGFFAKIFGGGSMSHGSKTTVAVPPEAARYVIIDSGGTFYGSSKTIKNARKVLAIFQQKFGNFHLGIVDTGLR
jgi:hypothetical protein